MNAKSEFLVNKKITITASLSLFLLASCGNKEGAVSMAEIVAKVDGVAITQQRLAIAIDAIGSVTPEQRVALSGQILERMIDQELISKKAVEENLDQDLVVAAGLENARIQVLSQKYIDRIVESAGKPTPEEIKQYYSENPYLFEKRRVYRFQEFSAKVSDAQLKMLQAELGKNRNLNDAARWMKAQNIPFNGDIVLRAAEQIPMEDLSRIYEMKIGDIAVIPRGERVIVFQVVAIQEAPVTEVDAMPLIERILVNQRRAETMTEEGRKLRAGVKVEYFRGSSK